MVFVVVLSVAMAVGAIAYRLSWNEGGEARYVEGRETLPARRVPQVRKGCEVDIRYLDDDRLSFVFDA